MKAEEVSSKNKEQSRKTVRLHSYRCFRTMENQPSKANMQPPPVGYSIVFSPDKPQATVPKCVTEYKSKTAASPGTLQKKLDKAAERKKVSN